MPNIKSKKGFTIIEVVLVLAIAGLIFLMVFIALPAMQRSQRDTQRRNDYSLLSTAMTNYMTSNNGKLPTALTSTDSSTYINDSGQDPNGFVYELMLKSCGSTNKGSSSSNCTAADGSAIDFKDDNNVAMKTANSDIATRVYVVKNAGCDSGHVVYKASSRAFAIYGQLETGNGTYCSASS